MSATAHQVPGEKEHSQHNCIKVFLKEKKRFFLKKITALSKSYLNYLSKSYLYRTLSLWLIVTELNLMIEMLQAIFWSIPFLGMLRYLCDGQCTKGKNSIAGQRGKQVAFCHCCSPSTYHRSNTSQSLHTISRHCEM